MAFTLSPDPCPNKIKRSENNAGQNKKQRNALSSPTDAAHDQSTINCRKTDRKKTVRFLRLNHERTLSLPHYSGERFPVLRSELRGSWSEVVSPSPGNLPPNTESNPGIPLWTIDPGTLARYDFW